MDNTKKNEEILNHKVQFITAKLNSIISNIYDKDKVVNSDVINFVNEIDSLKLELDDVKMEVVKEYLR